MEPVLLDAAGHRRSPATMPGYHQGRVPRNKSLRYPADPPTIEEIVAVMRAAGDGPDDARLRALIVVLWRSGLPISEALDLAESDLDRSRGAVLVRRFKGGRRRQVGMDHWAWDQLQPWLEIRASLPVGASIEQQLEGVGSRQPLASNSDEPQRALVSVVGSLLISSATLMQLRWPTRASPWS